MIDKKRLEELIEQGATIYEVKYKNINSVSLKNEIRFISEKYPVIVFEPRPNEKYKHHKYFDKLFETKEEAEWHKEFGCIERTERLELPTWEEFISNTNGVEFNRINGDKIRFHKLSGDKVFTMYDKNGKIHFEREWFLTKENYIEACRKAKKLFLGETK